MHESRLPVIGFVARSGSGKTTLLQKLVPLLRERGLRIGYLKHAHHTFDLDVPGKDSYEIRRAGALQTLLASRERWALQSEQTERSRDPSLKEMLGRFDANRLDLILVEGFKHSAYPKIEIHRTATGQPPLYPDDPDVIAVVTDSHLSGEVHPPELPLEDTEAIAGFVQRYMEACTPAAPQLRAELVRYYRQLRRYGCSHSYSGSASSRSGETFWVTPTGVFADTLEPDELMTCPIDGPCPETASPDAPLHQHLYQKRPEATAVLHSHGPYSVAMSFAGQEFRPVDLDGQSYFERVPVISVDYQGYVEKALDAVGGVLAEHRIAMVRGHGVYAWGETLELAYRWTCALELSAKTSLLARQAADL
jgi:molybdopterin-guanine dinucleotide biosynthesis protein MobB